MLVIITGAQAVGKMTVGEELARITELDLFHNHMTIDFVGQFFNYSTKSGKKLVRKFRDEIMNEYATSDKPGMIFTFVWSFGRQEDWDYIDNVKSIFKDHEVVIVELLTDLETRLERNKTENRLEKKPSKRDLEWSENDILNTLDVHRLVSNPGEIKGHYLRIDNTNLSALQSAMMIKDYLENNIN
jgi:hypothetical protein